MRIPDLLSIFRKKTETKTSTPPSNPDLDKALADRREALDGMSEARKSNTSQLKEFTKVLANCDPLKLVPEGSK